MQWRTTRKHKHAQQETDVSRKVDMMSLQKCQLYKLPELYIFFFSTEVCHALNVTVTPGPVVMVTEKDNFTLSCLVSQRKRSNSVLIVRWFFSPLPAPTLTPPPPSPSPSPHPASALEPTQFLIVKMGIRKMKLYGNYTRRFPTPKFRLHEETEGELYRLWIFNVMGTEQGFYTCKVQEIRKHKTTWRASSNGTSTTQLTGN